MIPTKTELEKLYNTKNILEIAQIYDVRSCSVHTWITKYGIKRRKGTDSLDLRGKRFGGLVAKKYVWGERGKTYWECQCDCGGTIKLMRAALVSNRRSHCGCLGDYRKKRNKESGHWKGIGDIPGSFFSKHKNHAIRRGIRLTTTREYLFKCIEKQDYKCALTGDKLWFIDGKSNASIDRIDSSKGYEKGNIQWVTIDANFAKQRLSNKEFIELCQKVVNNR